MEDEDLLDGCEGILETTEHDDDETAALRPLFPRGEADAHLAAEWRELLPVSGG